MQCDHTIAVSHDCEGSTLYKQSEIGEFRTADEIFRFCPQCGKPITLTAEDLDNAWWKTNPPFVGPPTQMQVFMRDCLNRIYNGVIETPWTRFAGADHDTITIRLPNRYTKEPTT